MLVARVPRPARALRRAIAPVAERDEERVAHPSTSSVCSPRPGRRAAVRVGGRGREPDRVAEQRARDHPARADVLVGQRLVELEHRLDAAVVLGVERLPLGARALRADRLDLDVGLQSPARRTGARRGRDARRRGRTRPRTSVPARRSRSSRPRSGTGGSRAAARRARSRRAAGSRPRPAAARPASRAATARRRPSRCRRTGPAPCAARRGSRTPPSARRPRRRRSARTPEPGTRRHSAPARPCARGS